jgi:hypothetical protein
MIDDWRAQANFGIIGGLLVQLAGGMLLRGSGANLGFTLGIAGLTLVTWGGFNLMRVKGYPPALGLLGILPLVGVAVLLLLPKRRA